MSSCKNISDQGYLSENWEEDLWNNVLFPNPNTSNTSNFQHQFCAQETPQVISEKNAVPTPQCYQMQLSASYQNVESSSLLSPTWEDSALEIPQNCTNMSTYFSTFDPSQFQETPVLQSSVKTSFNMKTQNATGNRKMHSARINLVPTGNGNFKAVVKRKRKRTVFTTEQLEVLEEVFSVKPYVTRDERQLLVEKLQVNDKSVKIWFQNRRLKNKKGDDQDLVQDDSSCTIFERLNTVESKIMERTDEFGYVTLDDKIMKDLVNVVDDYFSSNISSVESRTEVERSPIYEPISPASTSDYSSEENASNWQHYEQTHCIQELMDLDSIITT